MVHIDHNGGISSIWVCDSVSGFQMHNVATLDTYRNGAHARERLIAFKHRIKMWEEPQADD